MEAFVELVCPGCDRHWEESPSDLPDPGDPFDCPDCEGRRRLSEYARTTTDLEVIRDAW